MKNIVLLLLAAVCAAACKKPAPPPEPVPQPKAEETAAAPAQPNMLQAPAAYVKNTVSQVDKAKAAAALYEKTAKDTLGAADGVGGN